MSGINQSWEEAQNRACTPTTVCEVLALGIVGLTPSQASTLLLLSGNKTSGRTSHLMMAAQSNSVQRKQKRYGTDSFGTL
jgi:hypothetical protein